MFYPTLIFIFLFLEIVFCSFLLSQYVCYRNNFFESNFFGRWMIGISVYFGLSIFVFFPFTFFISTINIIYLIVLFLLKDFFVYLFLFLRRKTYLKFDKQYLNVLITICITIIIWIIYFFGFKNFIEIKPYEDTNVFNVWNIFNKIQKTLFIDNRNLQQILLHFLTIFVIYNVIMTFIYELSSYQSFWEFIIGFAVSLISILLFNFQKEIHFNIFVYFVLFSLILAIRFIIFSRRRYAIMFGLSNVIAYSMDKNALLPLATIAICTLVIYTLLEKPKVFLFWIVLLIPIIFLISLNLYNVNIILFLAISIVLIYIYIFVLNTGRSIAFSKIDSFIKKYKFFIPTIIMFSIILSSILGIFTFDYNIESFETIRKPILDFSEKTNKTFSWIEFTLYLIFSITIISLTFLLWWRKKGKVNKIYLMMVFISLFLIGIYNPLANVVFQKNIFFDSFKIIKTIIFIPLLILLINFLKSKFKNIFIHSTRKNTTNIKKFYN